MGSLLRRAHFESLRAAEAKNSATINQLKYRALRQILHSGRGLGKIKHSAAPRACFIGSRPHPRAIFAVMHSHGTLTSIYNIIYIYISLCVGHGRFHNYNDSTVVQYPRCNSLYSVWTCHNNIISS